MEQARPRASAPGAPAPLRVPAQGSSVGDGRAPAGGASPTAGAPRDGTTAGGARPARGAEGTAAPHRARDDRDGGSPATGAGDAWLPSPGPARTRGVRRHSVREQVLQALRAALVDGELAPGAVYSAPALGERYGVSATPVREAMQQLAVEGAVEVVPNRGFRVCVRTGRELAELAEVRALIEVPVMLRLARTVPADRWTALRPLAEATVVAAAHGDRASYADSDRAFHRAVLAHAGNEQLLAVADDLHRRSQWPLSAVAGARPASAVPDRAVLVADAAEHMALLEALIARDLTVVQSLVREHFAGADV